MRILLAVLLAPLLFACAKTETGEATSVAVTDEGAASKLAVQAVYDGFATGDMEKVAGAMSPDIVWNEAESAPYADNNPYVGPDAIFSGLFARLGGEWDHFEAIPAQMVAEGGDVAVFGRYHGTHLATGKTLNAQFVHHWMVKDGKIASFQQYTDTAQHVAVMSE
ncbi:MAG TPA: nuclear transport factor 2 family protein [Parvularculaceae bacterium]|nr:nuclear transport factor 2 family protein [Amphiplicatus sp.]MCB9955573.1 nuclear transport factor 2 family protein [Caulobacterales bacterium]HPE32544.1 nuclear transport factor 2 family protein [Parvularculaceae bacterium]